MDDFIFLDESLKDKEIQTKPEMKSTGTQTDPVGCFSISQEHRDLIYKKLIYQIS